MLLYWILYYIRLRDISIFIPDRRSETRKMDLSAATPNILDLNDDCLRAFCDRLELPELCAIADCCSRLRWIAQERFKRSYGGKVQLHQLYRGNLNDEQQLKRAARFLRNFGTFITSINTGKLTFYYTLGFDARIIELIASACRGTLRELTLTYIKAGPHLFEPIDVTSKFERLRTLRLQDCWYYKLPQIMEICRNLELAELAFDRSTHRLSTEELLELIRNNKWLRHFQYNQIRKIKTQPHINMTLDAYKELLKIVGYRRARRHLTIELLNVQPRYGSPYEIPKELARQNENILTLIQKNRALWNSAQ